MSLGMVSKRKKVYGFGLMVSKSSSLSEENRKCLLFGSRRNFSLTESVQSQVIRRQSIVQ